MRFFTARRLALVAFLPVLFGLTFIPGCSKQSEGDRCGDDEGADTADGDCDDGLVCTQIDAHIYRCCNPSRTTNARCVKVVGSSSGGNTGDAGAGGDAGSSEAGGASSSGGDANVSGGGSGGASAGTAGAAGSAGDSSPSTEAGAGGT